MDKTQRTTLENKITKMSDLYGCLFRQVRLQQGFSIENVAKAIGVSKGTLWEAEQGKRRFSLAALKKGMHFMGASYQEMPKEAILEVLVLIQRFITACYFYDISEQERVCQKFLTYHFNRHQTFDDRYYYLLSLELLIQLQTGDPTRRASIFQGKKDLDEAFDSFPKILKELYYCLQVMWLDYNGQLMAIESYVENLFSMTSQEQFQHLQPLVGYYALRSSVHNRHLSSTYRYINLLREFFQRDLNYTRMIFLDNLEGICWVLLEQYDMALERFERILRNVNCFQLSAPCISVHNSILWCYLMKGDYEKAIEEGSIIETLFGCHQKDRNLIFTIYAEYRLGHLQQAKVRYFQMKEALAYAKYRDQALLEAFHALLFEDFESFEQKCEEIYQNLLLEDWIQAELARFLLKALLYEYECQHKAKEAYFLRIRLAKITKSS